MRPRGVGVITATALVATIGDGSKNKLGRISKRGDGYIRRLLVHGARTVLRWHRARPEADTGWADQLLARRPTNVVLVAMANKTAREMIRLGHEVKLIPPRYVKPFVKRQKNDAADAEAIVIAAQRPEMRFTAPKSEEQQARAVLFRSRERLVHQRTELVKALRSHLYEFGYTIPQGIGHLNRVKAILDDPGCDLLDLVGEECHDLLDQISEMTVRIGAKTKRVQLLAGSARSARWQSKLSHLTWRASNAAGTSRPGWVLFPDNIPLRARSDWAASPEPGKPISADC